MSNANGRRSRRHPDEHQLVQAVEASAALRQLIEAASAPPSPAELKGRSQAIADFRAARPAASLHHLPVSPAGHPSRPGPERRPPARLAGIGRWSAARVTVACAALVALLGATAVQAAAGELPTALQNAVSDLLNTPAPAGDSPAPAPASSTAEPTVRPEPGRTGAGPSAAPHRSATSTGAASPSQLAGLCRAYQAAGSAVALLARPGFAPLVTAADGVPGVAAFCPQLPGPVRTAPPSVGPSSAHRSGAHPLNTSQPDTAQPDTAQPDTAQPDTAQPYTAQPDTAAPAAAAPAARPVTASQASGRTGSRSQPRASRSTGRHG